MFFLISKSMSLQGLQIQRIQSHQKCYSWKAAFWSQNLKYVTVVKHLLLCYLQCILIKKFWSLICTWKVVNKTRDVGWRKPHQNSTLRRKQRIKLGNFDFEFILFFCCMTGSWEKIIKRTIGFENKRKLKLKLIKWVFKKLSFEAIFIKEDERSKELYTFLKARNSKATFGPTEN